MEASLNQVREDFDRIALVSADGAARNDHYHDVLLRRLPLRCAEALEVGCGTGAFARRLAERADHVLALDLSPEMIRVARERSGAHANLDFELADVMSLDLPANRFNCIATIATLHHLPFEPVLLRLRDALAPGGTLAVLDLRPLDAVDWMLGWASVPLAAWLKFRSGASRTTRETRAAWDAHARHDVHPRFSGVRRVVERLLPGADLRRLLLWRYLLIWRKP